MPKQEPYWVKRERENIKREQMKDEEVAERLKDIINHALREIEKEINTFYAKYEGKNNLTPGEARWRVSEMDIQSYERLAARYVADKNFSDKANKMLSTYNTKMRINRQELLMLYLNAHLVAMADEQVKTFQSYLEQAGIDEVLRQAGILGVDMTITTSTLKSIVGASFYGATWSERIWGDMEGLREELDTIINSSIIRGVHPNRYVKQVRERFDVSSYEARRLLITETGRVQIESQRLSYLEITEDDPAAEYEIVAIKDERTTKICRKMDGKKFKVKDMQVGVNAPVFHPFCRTSTALLTGNWREGFFKKTDKKYSL